ncbi:LysR family transcriptional regulator [Ornithinibacillus sp. 4-3]|uniref:LysR family transcriptional regulator n=1 Tax=Ornithinibacillus sp. 4-3 TaxID=3231488 RepID=A0AB39HUV4_9BACI
MRIEDYELLIQLNEIGTIRGTAKVILVSQPAVSQRLKMIEDYFGMPIFIRTPKRLIPTPTGELILAHAKQVVEKEKNLLNTLAEANEEVRGTLSIACSSLISQRFLPAILATYTKQFPNVSIDLVTGISEDIKRNHKNFHVCIIRGEKLKDSTCTRLFEDPLYIFDTEDFSSNDLKERPLISFKSDDSMHELVENWLQFQHHIKPQKAIRVDQIETCKQFMKQGIGMAVLPKSVSESLMEHYPHLPLKVNGQLVTRDTWLCYQEGITGLPQVAEFIKAVLANEFLDD